MWIICPSMGAILKNSCNIRANLDSSDFKSLFIRGSLISENLASVQRRIKDAARKSGRNPESIELVVVSKGVPLARIIEAKSAGAVVFGESRVQEAVGKITAMGHGGIRWHLIGHLQKNKVKHALGLFDLIQSVDSAELAGVIDRLGGGAVTPVLIQVNVSGEAAKFGVAPGELEPLLASVSKLRGVRVEGLMTIPPYDPDPEKSRKHFACLRELRDGLVKTGIQNISLDRLSMGMSNDFEVAVEEGATLVRVGTAIFGER